MVDWSQPLVGEDDLTYRNRLLANAEWGEDLDFAMTTGVACLGNEILHDAGQVDGRWVCRRCDQRLIKNPQGRWSAVPPPRP